MSERRFYESPTIRWYTPGDLGESLHIEDSARKLSATAVIENACTLFPHNTVYLVSIGATVGKVGYSEHQAYCNQQINALVPKTKKLHHKYLTYYLVYCKQEVVRIASASTLPIINQTKVGNIPLIYPPLSEQQAIVSYLDSKVSKIDEYISAAEKKIAALEELKQSLIAEAVTRGINPNVPMKESGVKWIGMIPEHWEIRRLKNIVLCNSDTLSENFPKEEVIKYVEISDVNYTSGIINVQNISFGEAPSRARRITKKNDVIVSTVRTYLKAVAKIQEDGLIVSTGFAVLHPIIGNSSFLSYFVLSESFINNVIADSKGISYPAISTSDLVCIAMPLPPLPEQQAIVAFLDTKTAQIDRLCQSERSQIEKLKEYKQRLISDVVTGKVDVS